MSASAIAIESKPVTNVRWIISRGQDLTWFIGSAAVSYASIAALQLGAPFWPIFFLWLLVLDGPHVISTVTRTYFDPAERHKLGHLVWIVMPAVLAGPLFMYAGYDRMFMTFAVVWQAWHVAKQHFGFVMLYKAKNRDRSGRLGFWIDKWAFVACIMIPLGCFMVSTLELPARQSLRYGLFSAYGLFLASICGNELMKWRRGEFINLPKLMLMGCVLPLPWVAYAHAIQFGYEGLVRMTMAGGMFHAIQYHRLMWLHNTKRYQTPGNQAPVAAFFSRNVGRYLILVIGVYAVIWSASNMSPYVNAAAWGIAFTHYILDGRIWRVREDKQLAAALGF